MDFQTRYLRYFLAVAEELSFSRAAARLGVSQPALSQRIRDLEALFEFPLFERAGRHVALSAQGQALLAPARDLLSHVRQFEGEIGDLRASAPPPLLLGATIYSDFPERTGLVTRFIETHPEEQLELETGYTVALFEGLLAGEFDFAIITGPPPDERFETIILRWFEIELIVPESSPLVRYALIPPELLRSSAIASFRRKRHPMLFDRLIQPLADLGATIDYPPDQSPGGILAFAAQHGMIVPAGFPMHSDEKVRSSGMVRRGMLGATPLAALQLVRARDRATGRRDRFWNFANAFALSIGSSAIAPPTSAISLE